MLTAPWWWLPSSPDRTPPSRSPARLLDDALELPQAEGIDTLYTRPQGLDRVWVRNGFIPIPEAELPEALRGRPGIGLFGWRGGTAIWSSAGRARPRSPPPLRPPPGRRRR